MKKLKFCLIVLCALTLLGVHSVALGDWDESQDHKMHFPQLPQLDYGWDICLMDQWLADDFVCSETGFIEDIHIWISFRDDNDFVDYLHDPDMWDVTIRRDVGGVPGPVVWPLLGQGIGNVEFVQPASPVGGEQVTSGRIQPTFLDVRRVQLVVERVCRDVV